MKPILEQKKQGSYWPLTVFPSTLRFYLKSTDDN